MNTTAPPKPKARSLPKVTRPAVRVMAPVNPMFGLESVKFAPKPFCSRPPLPTSAAVNVVEAVPLRVSVLPCTFTNPDPPSEAISSLPASFSVPLPVRVTAMVFTNAEPPASVKVPPFTSVWPV